MGRRFTRIIIIEKNVLRKALTEILDQLPRKAKVLKRFHFVLKRHVLSHARLKQCTELPSLFDLVLKSYQFGPQAV